MYARWVLTALLVWPAVAAVAILIAPPRWAKHLGFVASMIEFAIAVPLWWTFVPSGGMQFVCDAPWIQVPLDRKSTRLNSSHGYISYAVFCLKKKKKKGKRICMIPNMNP